MELQSSGTELLLTFSMGNAYYGLQTTLIQEVIFPSECSRVFGAPEYVKGIVNLRGKIVTMIDLASRINVGKLESGEENRVLVVPWKEEQIGLLVESVSSVVKAECERMLPPPDNIDEDLARFIKGVYQEEHRLIALLDLDTALSTEVDS